MALDVRKFGPKSDKIGAHRGAFVYQEQPFKKDSSTASRVINEVVLGGSCCELRHNGVLRSSRAEGSPNFRSDLPRTATFAGHVSPRRVVCTRCNQEGGIVRYFYPSRKGKGIRPGL